VSQYQKGKTNQDFTEPRDSEWQWLQTDNHASTPPLSFFTGRMPFLPPNQQNQCTEGIDALNALTLQCADAVGWCNVPTAEPIIKQSAPVVQLAEERFRPEISEP